MINVETSSSMDWLFIKALTGSIYSYIEQGKNNLIYIIDRIIEENHGIDINFGFIWYRDIEKQKRGEYVINEFTKNHIQVKENKYK